jgi:hypothetical protein
VAQDRTNFEFEELGEFQTEFEENLANATGAQMGSTDEKKPEEDNLALLSLKAALLHS